MIITDRRLLRRLSLILLLTLFAGGCKRRVANLTPPDPGGSYKIEWIQAEVPPTMKVQQSTSIRVSIRNAGDTVISGELFALAYHWMDAADPKRVIVWDGLRTVVGRPLQPGEAFSAVMRVKAPDLAGRYILNLDALHEGVAWFSGRGSPMSSHEVTVE